MSLFLAASPVNAATIGSFTVVLDADGVMCGQFSGSVTGTFDNIWSFERGRKDGRTLNLSPGLGGKRGSWKDPRKRLKQTLAQRHCPGGRKL